jgi:hypothetical protein
MSRFLDRMNVTPLADGVNWCYNSIFRYHSDLLARTVESPVLRITDFTSTPKAIWNIIPPWGTHAAAACIHDELYWLQDCERDEADGVLREALHVLAEPMAKIQQIYLGVRAFGQHAWDRNAELKANGYTRLASPESLPPYAAP